MRNPKGYLRVFDREGNCREIDTFTCAHHGNDGCQGIVEVPAGAPPNAIGWCRECMKPICNGCVGQPCRPFERAIELSEAQDRTRREYAAIL